jgi:hypothetical protein
LEEDHLLTSCDCPLSQVVSDQLVGHHAHAVHI